MGEAKTDYFYTWGTTIPQAQIRTVWMSCDMCHKARASGRPESPVAPETSASPREEASRKQSRQPRSGRSSILEEGVLDGRDLTIKDGHGLLAGWQGLLFCQSSWRGLVGTGLGREAERDCTGAKESTGDHITWTELWFRVG